VIKINKAGYIYIALTILIGFSAVNTGNNLIYIVTSALLSYMLVSGIFGRRNIQGIDILMEFPQEMFAGMEFPVGVKVMNRKRFMPAFLIGVSVGDQRVTFPFVEPGSEAVQYIHLRFEERGRYETGDCGISSVFPFNFFSRYRKVPKRFSVTVFPQPQKCDLIQPRDSRAKSKGDISTNAAGFDADILSIRDYVLGDPVKYISWKSTAKTGRLKTKELSSIELESVIIDFDRMDKPGIEFAISCTTYTILKLMRSKVPVGLSIGGETFKPGSSPGHRARLLTKLALYGKS
jgi:uncharacterized protein (DUF58 family)